MGNFSFFVTILSLEKYQIIILIGYYVVNFSIPLLNLYLQNQPNKIQSPKYKHVDKRDYLNESSIIDIVE